MVLLPVFDNAPRSLSAPRWYGLSAWGVSVGFFAIAAASTVYFLYGGLSMLGVALFGAAVLLTRWPAGGAAGMGRGRWLVILVLVALAPRVLCVLLVPYEPSRDYEVYNQLGLQMARTWTFGEGFRCYQAPGQVFTLGIIYRLTGGSVKAAQLVNCAIAALTVVGIWRLGRAVFGEAVGRLAGLLAAVLPSSVFACLLLGSQVPEAFWLVLVLAVFATAVERRGVWWAVLCGVCIGVGTLIRPTYLLLPAVLGFHALLSWSGRRRRAALCAGAMLLGTLVVVLPWTWRNYKVTGGFVLISSNSGQVLYSANCDDANGSYNQAAWDRLYPCCGGEDARLQDIGTRWAVDWIKSHPGRFLTLAGRKFLIFWCNDKEMAWWALSEPMADDPYNLYIPRSVRRGAEALSSGFYIVAIVSVVVALVRFRGLLAANRAWIPIALAALYMTAVHMVYESQAKYHYPLVGPLCILAALAYCRRGGSESGQAALAEDHRLETVHEGV